jgi:D-glucosaminate-6-phosphate ammonia-lyase
MKVSKEQIVAFLTAFKLFTGGAYLEELAQQRRWLETIAAGLQGTAATARLIVPADGESLPLLEITLDEAKLGRTAWDVCRRLRHGKPPVHAGHGKLDEGMLTINPLHLNEERTALVLRRLREEL